MEIYVYPTLDYDGINDIKLIDEIMDFLNTELRFETILEGPEINNCGDLLIMKNFICNHYKFKVIL